jgi:SHS2 domain-containing protein
MKLYEFLDHTGDIAIRAHGDNLGAAFGNAARAMFEIITGCREIAATEVVTFEVESVDRPGLLVGFLSELIVRHEVDRLVFGQFDIAITDNHHLQATARGEIFDPDRHGDGTQVKGVSYHMMEIVDGSDGGHSSVTVIFDV